MHKLVEYICEELEELERKADKDGKLSMSEIEYGEKLADFKKNLLKGSEMMGESYNSSYGSSYNSSYGRNRSQDSYRSGRRGRMNSRNSYGAESLIEAIYDSMDDLPGETKKDAQRLIKKLEEM